jgi:dTDP-4-dehydrorhamnose reductase
MRMLITGGTGLVGGNLARVAPSSHQVWVTDLAPASIYMPEVQWLPADLTKAQQVRQVFAQARPEVVIHCAAISNIDQAERDRDLAWEVNVEGSRLVAACCRDFGARLVACSTDTVFGGERGGYRESDEPHPLNFYGRTKVEMERLVAATVPSWAIARLSMVYGLPAVPGPPAYLARLLNSLQAGEAVRASDTEMRTPVDVLTVRDALLELAEGSHQGLMHLAGLDVLSRRELAQQVAAQVGADPALVEPEPLGPLPGKAPRPTNATLDCSLARQVLATPMIGLAEGLRRVLPKGR